MRRQCFVQAIGVMLGGILLVPTSGHAGVLAASWRAPIANTDGSPLTELALYRVYYSIFEAPCPGSTFAEVTSPSPIPAANERVSFELTALTAGAVYTVSVTAVDAHGNESACSDAASGVARDGSAATPALQDGSAAAPIEQNVSSTPRTPWRRRWQGR